MSRAATITGMYHAMLATLGPSRWWPGDTPFEIAVGAILTQNTNWRNVEKAIANLKARDLLSARAMHALDTGELAELIRPAGYYNIKAARLRNFLNFLNDEAGFEIESLKTQGMDELRSKVLSINGVGPETADSILLYALEMPTFVVDAYTYRMMDRHGLAHEGIDYHGLRSIFMDALPEDVSLYNEFHALIVRVGKDWCRKKAGLCATCPLQPFLDESP
ncbi:MAG: endonuclease III domain-containing protein [Pseudodesulfovibrio sp.]|uniref:HhH-GPD family protein n=1 Tax=Pseudodesulfovibrio aespoeensis (strain ATCC 700646 / DSM 10631 / Aspo-2) TaxID=643562 RepID=E6VWM9_PSEA9|nr:MULTISPECIES: endonuclease III domain-containing protein [Pseudodesulfovibrio]MBU4377977.1 endonuclease III domain-containing protein [Pseudomonadota bacterium]ADU62530.1 HhH-GPD family protein [Pseudodesulfovibrio aespoeensis Aspo-2]MBU4473661.1 endonuclease III domain-containing protein [Pseudomonadota bacterium]MBU4516573.1 endonuclease III domain-containing protein [Pseudomonadota bacterium]MBU4521594.1 endonuclease III domain-containing protein [Pseudomonadota bacterium]